MNGGGQTAELLYLLCILVLVAGALFARRIPLKSGIKMFGAWMLIFLAGFILFQMKDRIVDGGRAVIEESRAESGGVQQGEELRVRQSSDGHFWITASVNGQSVRFLVDSGATTTSISTATAEQANVDASGGFPVLVQTANGTVRVQRGRVERLEIGHIVREDIAVHMSEAFGDMNVLGMNFLSSLSGWRVEGRNLILTP